MVWHISNVSVYGASTVNVYGAGTKNSQGYWRGSSQVARRFEPPETTPLLESLSQGEGQRWTNWEEPAYSCCIMLIWR